MLVKVILFSLFFSYLSFKFFISFFIQMLKEEREILRAIEWMERASRKSASQVVGGG